MKPKLIELFCRVQPGLLLSIFAIGFGITLLALAVMISSASAAEAHCREFQTKVTVAGKEENTYGTVLPSVGQDGGDYTQSRQSRNTL